MKFKIWLVENERLDWFSCYSGANDVRVCDLESAPSFEFDKADRLVSEIVLRIAAYSKETHVGMAPESITRKS